MRLWHKDLIDVLPRQQLLGQWRECCLIAKSIAENGTPNHLLVNRVMKYPPADFYSYAKWIEAEMKYRGYKCDFNKFEKWYDKIVKGKNADFYKWKRKEDIFTYWHNEKYLKQCFYNLQEKYDCGGITEDEWQDIYEGIMLLGVQGNGRTKDKQN